MRHDDESLVRARLSQLYSAGMLLGFSPDGLQVALAVGPYVRL
jgi:hypothetical protein